MTDESALLQLVRDNGDEPLPRLIYADWLDDIGDPDTTQKAAFLRLWCLLRDTPLSDLTGYQGLATQLEALKPNLPTGWLSDVDGNRFHIQNGAAAQERAGAFLNRIFDADDYEIRFANLHENGWIVSYVATPFVEVADPPPREKEHKRGGPRKPKRSHTKPPGGRARFGAATPLFVERTTGHVDWHRGRPLPAIARQTSVVSPPSAG